MTPQLRILSIPLPLLILHRLLLATFLYGVCWTLSWPFRRRMDRFWWMCSRSFRLYVLIWWVLNGLLHYLLLMMIYDFSLAIRHKKGEYILMEIWRILELFGALDCISRSFMYLCFFFLFGLWCIYLYMLGEDTLCFMFYCFLFHIWYIDYWFILWGYSWYMYFISYFVKSRIYFRFYLYFPCWKIWFCISYKTHSGNNKHESISFVIDNMHYVNFRI